MFDNDDSMSAPQQPMASAKKDNHLVTAKNLLSDIKKNEINLDNFNQRYREVEQTVKVLETTISNLFNDYEQKEAQLKEIWDETKKNTDKMYNDYMPKKMVELQWECMSILQKVYSYKSIQQEISQLTYFKFSELLILANAQKTQRDLLKETKQLHEDLIKLTLANSQVVVKNALSSIQRIADVMTLQNRTNTQVLSHQNYDSFKLFMDMLMKLRINNIIPENDFKDLMSQAENNHKNFTKEVKEIQSKPDEKFDYEETPELPKSEPKVVETPGKKKQQQQQIESDIINEDGE